MSTFSSLKAWLDYFEHRHREQIQLGLDRFQHALAAFELTFERSLVITVGGTNGKGSTVSALDAIYTAAGYRVGRYTSPHLFRFNERICIDAQEVTDTALCEVFERIDARIETQCLTYFEVTTLAALLLFHQENLDIILLEVGMGGRLDATNSIDADLSIITTVDLDHQAWLGQTVELIAAEKAGILRSGRPAIYADDTPPLAIIRQASVLEAPLHCLHEAYQFSVTEKALVISMGSEVFDLPKPAIHPKAAAAAVVASALLQSRYPVSKKALSTAMQRVKILGRQQWIAGKVNQLYDVGHNPQAVALLAESVTRRRVHGKIRAVFSALKDKDLPGLIQPMAELVDAWYPALLSGPRCASEELICSSFELLHLPYKKCYNTPVEAFQAAWAEAEEGDLVVVFGSFLTVSAVLSSQLHAVEEK